jgi:hypothetical protein
LGLRREENISSLPGIEYPIALPAEALLYERKYRSANLNTRYIVEITNKFFFFFFFNVPTIRFGPWPFQ